MDVPPPPKPRVLVTRALGQGSALADQLRALGAEPILIPAIELAPPTSYAALDTALTALDTFHWLLFTSANAVEAFAQRLPRFSPHSPTAPPSNLESPAAWCWGGKGGVLSAETQEAFYQGASESPEPRVPSSEPQPNHSPKIAAIGQGTARALGAIGLIPELVPPQAVAESLTAALLPNARRLDGTPTRFLLIRAEEAREVLPDTLRRAGAEVTIAPAYRTVIPTASIQRIQELFTVQEPFTIQAPSTAAPEAPLLRLPHSSTAPPSKGGVLSAEAPLPPPRQGPVDAITFTSTSTARNLVALCAAAGVQPPSGALRISIGPITSQTLRELGLPPHAEAAEATVPALARATLEALQQQQRLPEEG